MRRVDFSRHLPHLWRDWHTSPWRRALVIPAGHRREAMDVGKGSGERSAESKPDAQASAELKPDAQASREHSATNLLGLMRLFFIYLSTVFLSLALAASHALRREGPTGGVSRLPRVGVRMERFGTFCNAFFTALGHFPHQWVIRAPLAFSRDRGASPAWSEVVGGKAFIYKSFHECTFTFCVRSRGRPSSGRPVRQATWPKTFAGRCRCTSSGPSSFLLDLPSAFPAIIPERQQLSPLCVTRFQISRATPCATTL